MGVTPGVPPAGAFGSTGGQGSPIVINDATAQPFYYKARQGVTPLADPRVVNAAYAQINSLTPMNIVVNAGWTPMVNYLNSMVDPVIVVPDRANGTLSTTEAGVYLLNISFDLTFNEVNASQNYFARIFNVTDSLEMANLEFFVGRNTGGSSAGVSVLANATGGGKLIRLELGGGDTLANVVRKSITFGAHRVSN